MAVVTLTAVNRGVKATPVHGLGGQVVFRSATVEVGAADSDTSTYAFYRVPTNARILGASRVYWDDLASSGSPTLDIGLRPVGGNFTADVDALNDGLDAATVNNVGVPVVKDKANYGKTVWELLGLSADPQGEAEVYMTLDDADVNVGGTLTMEILYGVD